MLHIIENSYGGIIVSPDSLPNTLQEFCVEMDLLLASCSHKKLVWIEISLEKSDFIPILTSRGFIFHHCQENCVMLVKRVDSHSEIPISANFTVGVGAIVCINENILVVKQQLSEEYKLPGGYIEKNELLVNALKREVFEETGVNVQFESICNIGYFKNGQFGESSLYIVCMAKILSDTIYVHDTSEIVEARWMAINDFLESPFVNVYNKHVVAAAKHKTKSTFAKQHIRLKYPESEVFF